MAALEEYIHIIPLGHEYDRAVKPFEKIPVNRVYIISMTEKENHNQEMISRQVYFTNKVIQFFHDKHIDVISVNVDLFDILEVMRHISKIIIDEKEKGNVVHVNMSACSRKTSIGAALAGMANSAKVYYVIAESYSLSEESFWKHGLSICEEGKTDKFENFEFDLPKEVNRKILAKLYQENPEVQTPVIRDFLHTENVEGFRYKIDKDKRFIENPDGTRVKKRDGTDLTTREEEISQSNRLEKKYLNSLKRSGYIESERSGRTNVISITKSGKYIACITGMV